jgi:osmoprotectant transport system ATP-binding protein
MSTTDTATQDAANGRAMIRLDQLTKRFPGQVEPAVDSATMDIREGEIVVFVGPSGCGKTTSMRMINRLIEPSSGRIELEGQDVTHIDGNQLRRRIGYVIQQVGLFPHLKVGANVAMTPRLLGWDRKRTNARVDEMLSLVGLEPHVYRNRYPRELSGGQQQRVGVARGLAADPPVMLMDEPFGAVDPITRERLQNEFLRLQSELHKTIVFVTHDIDEAIKMGDRIAVLGDRFRIEQYDPPDRLLSQPANEFVASFVGAGASLKRLNLHKVGEFELEPAETARLGTPPAELRQRLSRTGAWAILMLNERDQPDHWLTPADVESDANPNPSGLPVPVLGPTATVRDALDAILTATGRTVAIVDESGAFKGQLTIDAILSQSATIHDANEARELLATRGFVPRDLTSSGPEAGSEEPA